MRTLTLVVAFLLVPRASGAQDPFEQRREADLASMTGVDPILLTLAAGTTTYRIGERIPISVEFQPIGMVGLLDTSCGPGIGLDVVLDRSAGTFAPGRERDLSAVDYVCGVRGGLYSNMSMPLGLGLSGWETAPPLKPTPVRETVDLNQAVRFDAPGRYRFYLRTRLTVPQSNGTPPRLSNILTVDIVGRDPAWEASLIARAAVQLDASEPSIARSEALADLSFLGTDAAVDLLVRRPDTSVLAVAWSARNRSYAIERMRERLANPSLPVDRVYVATLAAAEAAHMTGTAPPERADFDRLQRDYSFRRLRALEVAGRLDAELAAAMTEAAGDGRRGLFTRVVWQTLPAGFPAVPDAVERALLALPPALQRHVLAERLGWREFADPVFLPMLRRLAASEAADGPQDIALSLWLQLAPADARAFVLQQLAVPRAFISADGAAALPDALLPQFDGALAVRLEAARSGREFYGVLSLIERFSTGRIRQRVARAFERSAEAITCPQGPAALAYFLRVDPAYADRQFDRVWTAVANSRERCRGRNLLQAVAERRMSPALRRLAIARLEDQRPQVAVDAAEMLGTVGAAWAEDALWAGLDAWYAHWAPRAAELGPPEDGRSGWAVERALIEALLPLAAWRDRASVERRMAARCLSRWCRGLAWQDPFGGLEPLSVSVAPPDTPAGPPRFAVGRSYLSGIGPLVAHLTRWPRGTRWTWSPQSAGFGTGPKLHPVPLWLPGQEGTTFETVRRDLAAHGLHLVRQ